MYRPELVTLYGELEEMTPEERAVFFEYHPELLGWFRTLAKAGKRLFKGIGRAARRRRKKRRKRRRKKKLAAQRQEVQLLLQRQLIYKRQQEKKKKQKRNLMLAAAALPMAAMFLLGK